MKKITDVSYVSETCILHSLIVHIVSTYFSACVMYMNNLNMYARGCTPYKNDYKSIRAGPKFITLKQIKFLHQLM